MVGAGFIVAGPGSVNVLGGKQPVYPAIVSAGSKRLGVMGVAGRVHSPSGARRSPRGGCGVRAEGDSIPPEQPA